MLWCFQLNQWPESQLMLITSATLVMHYANAKDFSAVMGTFVLGLLN